MASNGVNVSRDLLWILTNNHNAHMFKRAGIRKRFTTDPLNPKGLQTFRNSGNLQKRAVNVQPHPSGKGVVLIHKKKRHQRSPAKVVNKISLRRSARNTIATIKRFVNGNAYRQDLKTTLLRRASALLQSQKKQPAKVAAKGKKE